MRIGIWGDSIVHGLNDYMHGGWPVRLQTHFWTGQAYEGPSVYALGIGGDMTQDILARFDTEYDVRESKLVIFSVGVNDSKSLNSGEYTVTPDVFTANMQQLVTKAQARGAKVVCLGLMPVIDDMLQPCPWGDGSWGYSTSRAKEFDALIKKVCADTDAHYLSMWDAVSQDDIKGDGIHPDANGHQKIFERVRDFLANEKLLE